MKRYRTIVAGIGGEQFQKSVINAIELLKLDPNDFVIIGNGASGSLCIDIAVEGKAENLLPVRMLTDHLNALRER